jgi:hypothetical protein
MHEQDEAKIEYCKMRMVSRGLHLKIGAMLLLYVSLILFLFVLIFFPEVAFADYFFWYALGTVLALTVVDFAGRLLCWKWPKDQSARLAVIGSTACQIASVVVLIFGVVERSGHEPFNRDIVFSVFLLMVVGVQAASAVLFMGYTRRVCKLLGQDDLAWRPPMVLAAYGLSGVSAMTLMFVSLLLLIVLWFVSCGGYFLFGPLVAFALPIRLAASIVVLLLVYFPFRSYGWFLFELAQAIDKRRKK